MVKCPPLNTLLILITTIECFEVQICQLMLRKDIGRKSAELINPTFFVVFFSLFRFSLLREINSIQFSTICNAR